MATERSYVRWTREFKPYDVTGENMRALESLADGAISRFGEIMGTKESGLKMKYNPGRFPSGFDDFAKARDCVSTVEQISELLKGPYGPV